MVSIPVDVQHLYLFIKDKQLLAGWHIAKREWERLYPGMDIQAAVEEYHESVMKTPGNRPKHVIGGITRYLERKWG